MSSGEEPKNDQENNDNKKTEQNPAENIDIKDLIKVPFVKDLIVKVDVLKKIKFGELEDLYLYLNDKIDREQEKIQGIVNYFEEKGITFNFISCDDDNDVDNFGGDADNLGGFKELLDNDD